MYRVVLSSGAIAALICTAASAETSFSRSAQVITLGETNRDALDQPAAAPERTGAPFPSSIAASASEQFRLHDLSRKCVKFQMARISDGPPIAAEPAVGAEPQPTWATDNILIPDWMRGAAPVPAPVSYTPPGCARRPYRVTGFLNLGAESRRRSYYELMGQIACEHGIPAGLFDAMIIQESRYNPLALSSKRAFGLTQLMPGTAALMGVDRFDVVDNLRGGARYLRSHLERFGRINLALAAYNAGPGRVRNARVPAIAETRDYVSSILNIWSRLALPSDARNPQNRLQRVAVSSAF